MIFVIFSDTGADSSAPDVSIVVGKSHVSSASIALSEHTLSNDQFNGSTDDDEEKKTDLYLSETHSLRRDRWVKIFEDFYDPIKDQFDLTKVPGDICAPPRYVPVVYIC